jgi:hypothetical protein
VIVNIIIIGRIKFENILIYIKSKGIPKNKNPKRKEKIIINVGYL